MDEVIKQIDGKFAEDLLKQMIRAPSVNPPGNVRECAEVLQRKLIDLGLEVELIEKKEDRTNVVARLRGKKENQLSCTMVTWTWSPLAMGGAESHS